MATRVAFRNHLVEQLDHFGRRRFVGVHVKHLANANNLS